VVVVPKNTSLEKTDKQPKQEQKIEPPTMVIQVVEANHDTLSGSWFFLY